MGVKTRVKGQLAKRAPRLDRAVTQAQWRARNRDRVVSSPEPDDPPLRRLLDDLRRDGIAVGTFAELFGSTELYDEISADARQRYERFKAAPPPADDTKPFLNRLLPDALDAGDAYARLALDPSVLAVANGYLGMRSMLRAVELWLTVPTEGPATATQLWHRDGDDVMNVKLFVYLTDVTEDSGPFCYAPRTHPIGDRTHAAGSSARSTDEEIAAVVPEPEWRVATGPAGTVILADTIGYHKQLKSRGGERMLVMTQYTSGTPHYPGAIEIRGADPAGLSPDQLAALSL
jgi:hypothetical protein